MGVTVRTRDYTREVEKAAAETTFKSLQHAGATVRKIARNAIKRRKKPSKPGESPHTRRGQLRRSILYAMDGKKKVLIGPSINLISRIGAVHEHGLAERVAKGKRKVNWRIEIGGHGPLEDERGAKYPWCEVPVKFVKIKTEKQLTRVKETVAKCDIGMRVRAYNIREIHYPQRPFMAPALQKVASRLPPMWRSSIK